MPEDLLLQNGRVYDPLNGVDGEIMDICVSDGEISESVSPGAKRIDLKGYVVMPGGVDLHSHIVGSKLGFGRAMCPEDHRDDPVLRTSKTRGGVGHTMPTSYVTGYRYSAMGYTTVIEPALPALKALSAWEELEDVPNLDTGMLPMFCNSMITFHYVREGDIAGLAAYIAWTLRSVGGLGVKAVNPGGNYAWAHGEDIHDLDIAVPHWGITPREITSGLCRAVELLGLPHPLHLHPVNLGRVGNIETTLQHLESLERIKGHNGRSCVAHLTHVSFESYDTVDENSDDWSDLSSGGLRLADYYNTNDHFSVDLGQITFGDATTMTADGPFEYYLYGLTKKKWTHIALDVELPGGAGVVPYVYREDSPGNSIQWAIPLEFALSIKDPWRCALSTDHPNAGPFTKYPLVISWLMSQKQRKKWLARVHPLASERSTLPDIEREWTLQEVAIATRAAPAKILGIQEAKGHLGPGADADIAVYQLEPMKSRIADSPDKLVRAFSRAYLTLQRGVVVSKKGRIRATPHGKVWSVSPSLSEQLWQRINGELEEMMGKWFAHSFHNYPVPERYRSHIEHKVMIDATRLDS